MFELIKDLLHFVEHFGATKFGDDKVVVEMIVAEGFRLRDFIIEVRIRVSEELQSELRIFLESKKRGKPERRYGFCFIHVVLLDE